MEAAGKPWGRSADGLVVTIRLTPKGGRDSIDGIAQLSDGSSVLKARVAAAPTEGEANNALIRLLAEEIGVSRRDVRIVAGATSRQKLVVVDGVDPEDIVARWPGLRL